MSKAFTKEDDDVPALPVRRRRVPLPDGVPNYLTAAGARVLRDELTRLVAGEPDADIRGQELAEHLATAEIVEPDPNGDRVRFGSAVTVETDSGARTVYRIVGVLEADPRMNALSWQSPIAKLLLGREVGDSVTLPRHGEITIAAISAS